MLSRLDRACRLANGRCCSFDYWGQDADWWLLETSGLPFGLTGDMIREGPVGANGTENPAACPDPNRWLGAVFGMASRLTNLEVGNPSWVETVPVWREWLDFDIASSQMIGWWEETPIISTGHDQVKATIFLHDGGAALIAVGNFANTSLTTSLEVSGGKVAKEKTLTSSLLPENGPKWLLVPTRNQCNT